MSGPGMPPRVRLGPVAWLWFAAGWLSVGLGALGVIVPGLPTTVFFLVAAWCFARCSPRFEQWVLDLPKIGPLVRDSRAGLGMPRRAKVVAIAMIVLFAGGALLAGGLRATRTPPRAVSARGASTNGYPVSDPAEV